MGAIRLFLACGVLFLHLKTQLPGDIGLHASATWVLNLISYVLNSKYPQTVSGTLAFYRSRFLRIYPLWWVVLFFCAVAGPIWTSGAAAGLIPASVLIGSDWIVAFGHYPDPYWSVFPPGAEIGWTLGAEVAFYLLAPAVLRSNRLAIALLAGSAVVRVLAFSMMVPSDPGLKAWTYLFFPSVLLFFLLGHLAEKLHRSWPIGLPASIALLLAAATATTCCLDDSTSIGSPWFHIAALCFAAALPGIFAATKDNRVPTFLGDLTYPLYLTHTVVISAIFSGALSPIGRALITASGMFDSIESRSLFVTGATLAIALCIAATTHFAIEVRVRGAFARLLDYGAGKILTRARRMIATMRYSERTRHGR